MHLIDNFFWYRNEQHPARFSYSLCVRYVSYHHIILGWQYYLKDAVRYSTMDNVTKADIYREVIVGFAVIQSITFGGDKSIVLTEPICEEDDGVGNPICIDENQSLVGVLPAPAGAYRVYGFGNDGIEIELGYEFPGAYHPNWIDKLNARRKED